MRKTLAIASIVKQNEEPENIEKLINSIPNPEDYFILVTITNYEGYGLEKSLSQLQKKYKFHIRFQIWEDDFAKARNQAIDYVNHTANDEYEWILFLDSDETLIDKNNVLMRTLEEADEETDGFMLNILSPKDPLIPPPNDYQCRLFRNKSEYRFKGQIHEQIIESILDAGKNVKGIQEVLILHNGYSDLKTYLKKLSRDYDILQNALKKEENPINLYFMATMELEFGYISRSFTSILRATELIDINHQSRFLILNRASQIALAVGKKNEALEFANRSISYESDFAVEKNGIKPGQVFPRVIKADILMSENKPEFALEYYKQALTNLRNGSPQPEFVFSEQFLLEKIQNCQNILRNGKIGQPGNLRIRSN